MKKVARAVPSVLFVTLVDAPYHLENKHIIIIITLMPDANTKPEIILPIPNTDTKICTFQLTT